MSNMRTAIAERTSIRCCGDTKRSRAGSPEPKAPAAIRIGRSLGLASSCVRVRVRDPIQRTGCGP